MFIGDGLFMGGGRGETRHGELATVGEKVVAVGLKDELYVIVQLIRMRTVRALLEYKPYQFTPTHANRISLDSQSHRVSWYVKKYRQMILALFLSRH